MTTDRLESIRKHPQLPPSPRPNLERYGVKVLGRIADQLRVAGTRKRETVSAIVSLLDDPLRLAPFVQTQERDTLKMLALMARIASPTVSPLSAVRLAGYYGIGDAADRLKSLVASGLALVQWYRVSETFDLEYLDETDDHLGLFVPAGVADLLDDIKPVVKNWKRSATPSGPIMTAPYPVQILREFRLVLAYIRHWPIEITQAGQPRMPYMKRMARQLGDLLPGTDERRIRFMIQILISCGAVIPNDKGDRQALSSLGSALHQAAPQQQLLAMIRTILSRGFDIRHLEFFADTRRDIFKYTTADLGLMQLAIDRDWPMLWHALAILPEGAWVPLSDVMARMAVGYPPLFFRQLKSTDSQKQSGKTTETQKDIQRAVFNGFVEEIAYPFGLVDWAIGTDRGLLLKLTELGVQLAHTGEFDAEENADEESGDPPLVVQPDFHIVAFKDRMTFEEQLCLWSFAVPETGQGHSEPVWRFRLERQAVLWAIEDGLGVDEILEKLNTWTGNRLPENVRAQLSDWSSTMDRVVVYRGHDLLEFDNVTQRDMADTDPRNMAIGDRFILTLDRNQTSQSMIDYSQDPEQIFMIGDDGCIRAHSGKALDLCARTVLERTADQEDSCWRLSREKLLDLGKESPALIEALKLRAASWSHGVYARVAGWTGTSGVARIRDVILIDISGSRLADGIAHLADNRHIPVERIGPTRLGVPAEFKADFESLMSELNLLED